MAIEDLLRREPVRLDETAIAEKIKGRAVLVTGAKEAFEVRPEGQVTRAPPRTEKTAADALPSTADRRYDGFVDITRTRCSGSRTK